jgi:hypothetical protein
MVVCLVAATLGLENPMRRPADATTNLAASSVARVLVISPVQSSRIRTRWSVRPGNVLFASSPGMLLLPGCLSESISLFLHAPSGSGHAAGAPARSPPFLLA